MHGSPRPIPRVTRLGAVLLLFAIAGCRIDQGLSALTRPPEPVESLVLWAPRPNDPRSTLRLLEWCWDHRQTDHYPELFTDDYRASCEDPSEPELTRNDELEAARGLFGAAQFIHLGYTGSLIVVPDSRPGKLSTWHRQITVGTTVELRTKSKLVYEVREQVRFFFVRGDSALIPADLVVKGFRPDPSRWYLERWESMGPAPGSARRTGATRTSWCGLKRLAL
jgi:hypothetical protein